MSPVFLIPGIVLVVIDVLVIIMAIKKFHDERSKRNKALLVVSISALPVLLITGLFLYQFGGERFTVSFSANDRSGTILTTRIVLAGSKIALPDGSELTRNGFTFGGWNTNVDGTGVNYSAGSSFTPAADITLYARWDPIAYYTVTFNVNDGDGTAPAAQNVQTGSGITLPGGSGLANGDFAFDGWNTEADGSGANYNANSSFTPAADITLYATWSSDITVPGSSLAEKLSWLKDNVQGDRNHIVEINANETIAPQTLSHSGSNITITLMGSGANRSIELSANGAAFVVGPSVTLILDNNITLQGRNNNGDYPLVDVASGGTFGMKAGSTIMGNSSGTTGGVSIHAGASFTMNGGTIYGNTGQSHGGVSVDGIFTMSGGTISGNNTTSDGGGVYISAAGTFIMSGGTISGNTANSGGGVFVSTDSAFTMSGGTISGNAANSGGGVEVSGSLTMGGGDITGNTASRGGGVAVAGGTFIISNGTVSGNTATNGGGVSVEASDDGYGTFNMRGGTISGNTARNYGGGVNVDSSSTFNKTGGTITGYFSDSVNGNVARGSSSYNGHAVYAGYYIRKETTAGTAVNLSFNGRASASGGAWDNSAAPRGDWETPDAP
jgi:uncharacterized repeat protein (TIGR02543 family)